MIVESKSTYKEQNRELKRLQRIACDHADKLCPYGEESPAEHMASWSPIFDAKMREFGWEYTADHCLCEDPEYGHEPACGWSRAKEPDAPRP